MVFPYSKIHWVPLVIKNPADERIENSWWNKFDAEDWLQILHHHPHLYHKFSITYRIIKSSAYSNIYSIFQLRKISTKELRFTYIKLPPILNFYIHGMPSYCNMLWRIGFIT